MGKRREIPFALATAAGLGFITRGIELAWHPGGWIFGGLAIILLAVLCLVEARG